MSTQPILYTQNLEKRRVAQKVQDLPPSGIRRFFDIVAETPGVISLGVGEPDFVTPWHICEAGIHALETGWTSYTANQGMTPLRKAISKFMRQQFGVEYNPQSEILVTVGGSEAIDLACRAVLEPGDEAIVLQPSFVSYAPMVTMAGGVPVPVYCYAANRFLPTQSAIESAVTPRTKMLMINFPNNPTGVALDRSTFDKIVNVVLEYDLLLVSDEVYVPLSYDEEPLSFCTASEIRDRLILLHGFSKAWAMTGWRLGFALAPADIIAAMNKIHQYSIMCTSTIAQLAAIEALEHGEEAALAMKREYDRRRRYVTHALNEMGLPTVEPKGAFYVFPDIRGTGLTSEEFALGLLKEEKVAVVPGTAFGECGEGHIRCSYASSMEALRKAMERIKSFVGRHS
ncbi:MAG TPA: aminotransferase class I/II-fold pyridoxal phosphate-dependent enzyme [bacterium]|nr:aminotransferase class I/II-fold pyridoxal phosphate-dependent enzyme [bacterium]HQL63436.1 aminotransferase class I/II-fold pyridoxal phosphate-dependent enzyme [bacterium]